MIRAACLWIGLVSIPLPADGEAGGETPATAEEAEALRRFAVPKAGGRSLAAFGEGGFRLRNDEVLVFAGQTNLVREQRSGELESILAAGFAGQRPVFRSMAWEGDTVHEQWRDLNFGSWQAQLDAAGATVVLAQFGQTEALDGVAELPRFVAAYHRLIDRFAASTPRLVLLSPMPFETPRASHAPDLALRNGEVKAYAEAVRGIARQRGAVFVDLFTPLAGRAPSQPRLTDNGLHLNADGLREVAAIVARQLGVDAPAATDRAALRAAIVEKNRLWFDCWRPANWSFVYGDRVSQSFGRPSAIAPSLKESFEARKPMVAALDAEILALARGETVAAKPLPPEVPRPDAPVISVADQLAGFTVAEGYEVNLFACEELGVVKPTQISWDERGRMFVACSPGYPQAAPGAKPADFILLLEDADRDGRADRSQRFAEGLTMVQGVEPGAGGVYVCDFDRILHLRDRDGDHRADETRVEFEGFGIGDTHQLANSISHGPDGSLWFTQGLHAFSRVETAHGLARLDRAGVWRWKPRSGKLEAYFNGGKAGHNCWGVVFDDFNQPFHKSGDRPHGYYSLPGLVAIPDPDEYHGVGQLFESNPKTTSIDIIGTAALPDEVQGCAVIGGYFGHVVELHRIVDDGAGFRSEQLPKLLRSTGDAFRPVDVSVGPDGAIYLADWCNPVIGHYQASYADPARDRGRGRIWRISAKGRPPARPPELAGMTPAGLLEQLGSPERWTRHQAKRRLFDAPSPAVLAAADAWVAKGPDERALMEVCGVFEAHEAPRPELLEGLLAARDPRVRAYGARVAGAWAGQVPDALDLLGRALADPHPRVRLEGVVACARVPDPAAVEVAARALDHPRDRFIDHALVQVVKALKPRLPPELAGLDFGGNAAHRAYVEKIAGAAPPAVDPGRAIYESLCSNCHQADGRGLAGVYPSLAGTARVNGDPDALIKINLHGLTGPLTVHGEPFVQTTALPMPPMGLDDEPLAAVLTYVRSHFGNRAGPVAADRVKAVREATRDRRGFWTAGELGP
jgi:glucose/arabinose dehydrogenase/mono/diheme cytochrome c family protein